LISSPSLRADEPSRPIEVFAGEADTRRRLQRLLLEVSAAPAWAQLIAVEAQLLEAESIEGDGLHDALARVRPSWEHGQTGSAEIAARPASA
jgi:hypothetical protein